jgi:hypothetical protein
MAYVESRIYISGLSEAVAGLKAMGADKPIQELNLKIGGMVVKEAKDLAPERSGDLKGSIRASKSINNVIVQAGRDPLIPYANPINWGWFYDRKNFIAKNIKPTQFMNRAAGKVRERVGKIYMEELLKIYEMYAGNQYDNPIVPNRDILSGTTIVRD